jgi:hypothetical protein
MSTLQIGFFGLRNAGKTVGSTVLYLAESGDGLDVTVRDAETIKYLRPLAEALERGELPHPTMEPAPKHLKWRVEVADGRYDLHTTDFPGELLDAIGQEGDAVAEEAMAGFRQQVRDWFVHCDAILLFVDSTQEGSVRYRDALVQLLDEMSRRPTRRGSTRRAVGVVFTKGDAVAPSPEHLGDPAAADQILARHPLYGVVQRRLCEYGGDLKSRVFLTSALGWDFFTVPEKDRARRTVQPCNWFAAVRWAVEQAAALVEATHKQILDEIEQEIGDKARQDKAWLLADGKKVLRALDGANREYRLSTGPCAQRFIALRERLEGEKKSQRRARLLACAGAVLLLLGMGYHFAREARIGAFDAYDRLAEERPGEAGVRERVAFYDVKIGRRNLDWFWRLSDRRRSADARAHADRDVLARILAEEAFVVWSAEDQRHDSAGRQAHRHAAAKAYRQKHGAGARPERLEAVARVAEQTRPAFEADQAEWRSLADRPATRPDDCAQKIGDLLRYASRPDALMTDQARALAQKTRLDWDRAEYADLVELSRSCTEPDSFVRLEAAATDYLRPNRHACTMAPPVNDLLRKIADMRRGKDYSVVVKRVHIPAGSDLHAEFFGFPDCSVKITLGDQAYETKKLKPPKKDSDGGFTINVNQKLGPYRVAWGEEALTLAVVTNRSVFANNVASATLSHDKLVVARLNAPVGVKCRNGQTVTVVTECPDARLPTLPTFAR